MTGIDRETLRALVREVVREAVAGFTPAPAKPPGPTAAEPVRPVTVADQFGVTPNGPLAAGEKSRTEIVRLAGDQDLDSFVRRLLRLFENPKSRADLRSGRLTFRLAGAGNPPGGSGHRIDAGVVTERHLAELADTNGSGGTLILGRKAVLTPLAREKARTLGIVIEKERK